MEPIAVLRDDRGRRNTTEVNLKLVPPLKLFEQKNVIKILFVSSISCDLLKSSE